MAETEQAPHAEAPREGTNVIVRGYPKIVYLYLTWIVSLACGLLVPRLVLESGAQNTAEFARIALYGKIWMAVFTFNILVIAFEFSRIRSVAIVFALLALVLAGMHWGFLDVLGTLLGDLQLLMSRAFYFTMGIIFAVIFLLVYINSRFNYWEIQPNEILHHRGFLGDVNRYPTRGLRMRKEITDVMEFVLLRAGTLVMTPMGEERPIFLENVINLNKVEDKIQRLLGTMKVRIDRGRIGGTD